MQKLKKILFLFTIITLSKNNGWFGQSLFEKGKSLWKDDTTRHIVYGLAVAGAAATATYVHKNYFTLEGIYNRKRNELYRLAIHAKIQKNPNITQEEKEDIKHNIDVFLDKVKYNYLSPIGNKYFVFNDGKFPKSYHDSIGTSMGSDNSAHQRQDEELFKQSKKIIGGDKLLAAHVYFLNKNGDQNTLSEEIRQKVNNKITEIELEQITNKLNTIYRLKAAEIAVNIIKNPQKAIDMLYPNQNDPKGHYNDESDDRGCNGPFAICIAPKIQNIYGDFFSTDCSKDFVNAYSPNCTWYGDITINTPSYTWKKGDATKRK